MRISEDAGSWRARGIIRRDFRHTHGDPEVPRHRSTRKKSGKKKTPRQACKHVWVEVSYDEYLRYADRTYWRWYWYPSRTAPYWTAFSTYRVCAGCLATDVKRDKGKERAYYRRERAKRLRARSS